jgi:hypothetical protein
MVCSEAKTVVDVPVDVAQHIPVCQQVSKRAGAHLVTREDPVGVSIGRCVRDHDGGFAKDGLNQKEVLSDLLVRFLVAPADEWQAVLISCNATHAKIETPAVNGPDPLVLIAEAEVIVVARNVAFRSVRCSSDASSQAGGRALENGDLGRKLEL